MPATTPTIEPDVLAAFRAGDESALERVYRERYRALLDVAIADLGDPLRAARTVERVAADLWKERTQFDSPAAFERYFGALLHERIVREHGRVASLHRHESAARNSTPPRGAAPSTDVSWEHVKALLHPAVSATELSAMQSAARHHTAEHLAAVGRKPMPVRSIVLGVAAALAIVALLFVVPRMRQDEIGKALASPDARTVASKPGQRGAVKLSDGSEAVLGAMSSVLIPPGFASQLRAVKLEGTASFTVVPNKTLPFIVRADRATVTALGTTFDVSAYPGDRLLVLRVRQGEVRLESSKGTRVVKQSEAVSVESSGIVHAASATELAEALGWVDGEFVITDRSLRDALPIIRRWFDIDPRPADEKLLDRRVTMRVGLDSSRAAIRALQESAQVLLTYERNKALLYDVAPAARKD
jgi:ferric-dicitrate binding protein FerR (iron transport regulator)